MRALCIFNLYAIAYIYGINGLSFVRYFVIPLGVAGIVVLIFYLMPHIRFFEKHLLEKRALDQA